MIQLGLPNTTIVSLNNEPHMSNPKTFFFGTPENNENNYGNNRLKNFPVKQWWLREINIWLRRSTSIMNGTANCYQC